MTKINDGGPAFPMATIDGYTQDGMTLRDYFAAQALPAYTKWSLDRPPNSTCDSEKTAAKHYARVAYVIADAMLAARETKP